jgi:hypothetical protein
MNHKPLKLAIELIPRPLYGVSLYKLAPTSAWRKFRAELMVEHGLVCNICAEATQKSAELQAHEIWKYEELTDRNVARLTDVRLICKPCHAVEHFGNALMRVREGALSRGYIPILIAHFCKVNGADEAAFQAHLDEAELIWRRRSLLKWEVNFGRFVEVFPEVA